MQNIAEEKTALGFSTNIGAMFCYFGNFVMSLGLIYSIVVITSEKNNKFVRFHAWQSLFLSIVGGVIGIAGALIAIVGGLIDTQIGFPLFTLVIGLVLLVFGLSLVIMFILAGIKAYQGQKYKVPVIGNLAEKRA